jgi:hypothetical protein
VAGCRTTGRVDDEPQRSWWERRPLWLRIVIIMGAVGAFLLIWWLLPPLLYSREEAPDEAARLKAITDTRTALLAGLVGIGALGTLWLNARTQRFTAETLRISEAHFRLAERSQKESFELTERGHLTDRYAKAIEQLGDDNLDCRLGGIYALEQLATDSTRDRDQATIVEVLSAFVRVHSDPVYRFRHHLSWLKQEMVKDAKEERDKAEEHVGKVPLPVDVQAAVTVLGRLTGQANLFDAYLREVQLVGADLTEANLTGADLTGANLTGAKLGGVIWTNKTIWPSEELRKEIQAVSEEVKTVTGVTAFRVQERYGVPSSIA